ncbi:MAG: SBBP repeat-containing protein, partial [Thermoguttaceae bacterium]
MRPEFEVLETRRLLSAIGSASPPVLDAYAQNPLVFEPNIGQTAAQVQFLARGQGYGLYLTPDEAVLSLQKSSGSSSPSATPAASPAPAVLSMQLVGANATAGSTGLDKLASTTNYLGATQATSLTNIPNYGQVEYQNVYAGINLIYYGNQQQLEFNFVVSAGADPQTIALRFQGADSIALDGAGNLVLHTSGGDVVENAPVAYQTINGAKQTVAGAFVMQGTNQVGFQLGTYDPSQPLVIDPVVVYSTYLGGSGADVGSAIAVDSSGNTYVTGYTDSLDFTPPFSSLQPVFTGGNRETYVTKFGPSGNIVSATYLGGASTATAETYNAATSIAVDTAGDVFLTGYSEYSPTSVQFQITTSSSFPSPISPGVFALGAFVAELNPQLNQFLYSTYLGTSGSSNEGAG